jgi:hypothetical protein
MRIWGFLFNAGPQSGQKVLRGTWHCDLAIKLATQAHTKKRLFTHHEPIYRNIELDAIHETLLKKYPIPASGYYWLRKALKSRFDRVPCV